MGVWPVVYMFITSSALWRMFFFFFVILYTVSSLISLTYCEEPVVKKTLAAPATRVARRSFVFFLVFIS